MSQELLHRGSAAQTSVPSVDSASELLHHLDDVRRARNTDCVRLLQELTPHLHAARAVERELDRHLARRFNIFRYLRDDELGLSRIIADLLDPTGEHGQGTTFLEAMMELLGVDPHAGDPARSGLLLSGRHTAATTWKERFGPLRSAGTDKFRVVRERWIPGPRYIDVTVDIPTDEGPCCLAFENKPYADDQPRQCKDYLEFLDSVYRGRFLLVYMPPRYRMPEEYSLPAEDRERWKNHFCVLPYVAEEAPLGNDDPLDGDGAALTQADRGEDDPRAEDDATDHIVASARDDAASVGDGASLADWFGTCCKLSDAERLRWFLREGQLYCQHHFGDSTMTDTEARYIREYLDENPRHLRAAFAVARAWPAVKHDVCRRFLEHLRDRVEERVRKEFPDIAGDLDVGCQYGGDKNWSNYLRLYRHGWMRCEGESPRSGGRTAVILECGRGGPTSWVWGVRGAKDKDHMTEPEKKRREELEGALKRQRLSLPDGWGHWPQLGYPQYQDWTAIVPELVHELADGGGKIADHYVNGLLQIAEKAIPAIDEVELENR